MWRILYIVLFSFASNFLIASPAFQHTMSIDIYTEGLDTDVEVEFLLNSPSRFDWRMYYDQADPDSYLHIRFPFSYLKYSNEDGSYLNTFLIDRSVGYEGMLDIGTDSEAFLEADPVEQIQFLFEELKIKVGQVQYSLDINNLTSEALGRRGGWIDGEFHRPVITFTINREFLDTYCTVEFPGG